jgi:hypothetical protein
VRAAKNQKRLSTHTESRSTEKKATARRLHDGHVRFANALREGPMPVLCFRLVIAAIVVVCFTGGYNVGYLKFTLAPCWNPF